MKYKIPPHLRFCRPSPELRTFYGYYLYFYFTRSLMTSDAMISPTSERKISKARLPNRLYIFTAPLYIDKYKDTIVAGESQGFDKRFHISCCGITIDMRPKV